MGRQLVNRGIEYEKYAFEQCIGKPGSGRQPGRGAGMDGHAYVEPPAQIKNMREIILIQISGTDRDGLLALAHDHQAEILAGPPKLCRRPQDAVRNVNQPVGEGIEL